jgi:hypothetical protein
LNDVDKKMRLKALCDITGDWIRSNQMVLLPGIHPTAVVPSPGRPSGQNLFDMPWQPCGSSLKPAPMLYISACLFRTRPPLTYDTPLDHAGPYQATRSPFSSISQSKSAPGSACSSRHPQGRIAWCFGVKCPPLSSRKTQLALVARSDLLLDLRWYALSSILEDAAVSPLEHPC